MKAWIENLLGKLNGKPSNGEVIDVCRKLTESDTGDVGLLEYRLAELCIERLQPEPEESDFVRCAGCGGCRVRTGDACLSCGVVS